MFEIGRICMKTAGREAGKYCVVVAKDKEKGFVVVTGPKSVTKVKRRRCNTNHLEPTPFKIEIKENATDEEILNAYEKNGIFEKLNLPKPTEKQIEMVEKKEVKETKKDEKVEEKRKEEGEEKKVKKKKIGEKKVSKKSSAKGKSEKKEEEK